MLRKLLIYVLLSANVVIANDDFIVVQSTTSTLNSGLYDHILPIYKKKSGIVAVNLYDMEGNNFNTQRRRRRRRRLKDNNKEVSIETCFPFLQTVPLTNNSVVSQLDNGTWTINKNGEFPNCGSWDGDNYEWDPNICYVFEASSDSITCACTYPDTIQISANIITKNQIK